MGFAIYDLALGVELLIALAGTELTEPVIMLADAGPVCNPTVATTALAMAIPATAEET